MNCSCYGAVNLIEHGMKVVDGVLEKVLCRIVIVDEMQFGFMSESGTIDSVSILRWMQEEYHAIGQKLYVLWSYRKLLTEYQETCCNWQ